MAGFEKGLETDNEKANQSLPRFGQQSRFLLKPNVIAGRTTWCCGRFELSGLAEWVAERPPIAGLGAPCRGADLANVMALSPPCRRCFGSFQICSIGCPWRPERHGSPSTGGLRRRADGGLQS